ncbi:hypothetical protein PHYSODRAFT_512498 [Phytophthora sojae]|uniref:Uncharacterized protein n=1 Tax=Phytophthora sojae (strain P6497) TaxID=1094619 RepID=G4ZS81_PHYSP|nr:hypothetical protein PHYSODRAFT_512498 [Phytophthora sojae]EGZ12977.1 hypothetical protein PHYSODRAFT_512498 [Phytophthora sojae]|eukprot:XP_009530406.1 hypothetical protein PHYSODRAFT_512498 [Phytophthora sojae]
MAQPPPNPRPIGGTSVARSLAQAAAALRAQEWRTNANANTTRLSPPRYQQQYEENDVEQEQEQEQEGAAAMYDREAFYAELRERHRNLTHRQRLAREFFEQQQRRQQQQQQQQHQVQRRAETAYRQQEGYEQFRRQMQLQGEAAAASRHLRPPSYPPPASQLVASMVPRVNAPLSLERSKSPSGAGTPTSKRPVENEDNNAQSAPFVIEDPANDDDDDAADMEDDGSGESKKAKKRVRYLRDTDRRNIIKRIENGEKQAALAREFGVTRAAICHIKKNRFEILSRYNMLVKSAQEMNRAENFVGPPGVDMMVHEVRANSILLLMTMLRDNRSNGATFRRVAGRLIMILLEEALAVLGTENVEVITGTGHLYRGLERKHQFCGVAIGTEGFPFLVLFHQMEPDAPQGSIHVTKAIDRRGQRAWLLDHMDLPANIVHHRVLLFSATCSTGDAECKAIEALCSVGCDERTISLVVILVTGDGIVNVSNRFPNVKIITGGIDGKVDPETDGIIPGFGDFVSRYNDS